MTFLELLESLRRDQEALRQRVWALSVILTIWIIATFGTMVASVYLFESLLDDRVAHSTPYQEDK